MTVQCICVSSSDLINRGEKLTQQLAEELQDASISKYSFTDLKDT